MARLTQDRIRRALGQLGEGWGLDTQSLLYRNELVPEFRVPDEDNPDGFTRIELSWDEVREVRANKWGVRLNVATGTYRPMLNISHWHRSGEMWASFGLGRDIVLNDHEPVSRRTFATLARITREYTPEACRALAAPRSIDVNALLNDALFDEA